MIPEDNSLASEGFGRSLRAGWNGRPARCFRRPAESISRSEPER